MIEADNKANRVRLANVPRWLHDIEHSFAQFTCNGLSVKVQSTERVSSKSSVRTRQSGSTVECSSFKQTFRFSIRNSWIRSFLLVSSISTFRLNLLMISVYLSPPLVAPLLKVLKQNMLLHSTRQHEYSDQESNSKLNYPYLMPKMSNEKRSYPFSVKFLHSDLSTSNDVVSRDSDCVQSISVSEEPPRERHLLTVGGFNACTGVHHGSVLQTRENSTEYDFNPSTIRQDSYGKQTFRWNLMEWKCYLLFENRLSFGFCITATNGHKIRHWPITKDYSRVTAYSIHSLKSEFPQMLGTKEAGMLSVNSVGSRFITWF